MAFNQIKQSPGKSFFNVSLHIYFKFPPPNTLKYCQIYY